MHDLLTDLKNLLTDEVALHERLRGDLTRELEQDGEISGADYLKLQQRKYYWVNQIESIESRRIGHVEALARDWDVEPRALTLRTIIARAPEAVADDLQGSFDALKALVEEIRGLGRKTGGNAQARLKAIDATLAVIGEAARMHPTYSEAGRIHKRTPNFKHTSA